MTIIYAKLIHSSHFTILACCEKELLGKTFNEGKISFQVKESFYKGKLVSEKEFIELLQEANNINLFGEKPVRIAVKEGYLNENDVIKIQGIPHAQIIKF